MNFIAAVFETPLALGSAVCIPLMLFILCMVVHLKPMHALSVSFSVGFSMVGITLLIGRFGQLLSDIATLLIDPQGATFQVVDAGRKVGIVIASASEIGIYILPLAILINIVLLLTRCTRTINLDLWSFWLFAFSGAMVQSLTGNLAYGIVAAATTVVFTLVVADSSVKGVEKCCALPGVSFTNAATAGYAPIAGAVCGLVDKIPYKGRKDITFGWLQKRIGYFGDPVLLSTVLVAVICLANKQELIPSLQMAVQAGAYVFITPKLMLLLGDAIKPLAQGLHELSGKKLGLHGSLTIGLSSVNGLGNPALLLLCIAFVPFTVWLGGVIPNNIFQPSADFSMLPYMLLLVVAICRGGIFKSLLCSLLSVCAMFYCSMAMSGLFTQAAVAADAAAYSSMGAISSMYAAGNPVVLVVSWIASFGIAGMGLLVLAMLTLSIWNYNKLTGNVKIYVKKQRALRTQTIDDMKAEAKKRNEMRNNAVSQKREALRDAVEIDRLLRDGGIATAPDESEQITIFNDETAEPPRKPQPTQQPQLPDEEKPPEDE